jgi:hypothetical protein
MTLPVHKIFPEQFNKLSNNINRRIIMITILNKPDILQNFITDDILTTYPIDGDNLKFSFRGIKTILNKFNFKVRNRQNKKLLDVQIELKGLSLEKLNEVFRLLGLTLSILESNKASQVVLLLTLKSDILERYMENSFYTLKKVDDLFNITDMFGNKILANLNNYKIEKLFGA